MCIADDTQPNWDKSITVDSIKMQAGEKRFAEKNKCKNQQIVLL